MPYFLKMQCCPPGEDNTRGGRSLSTLFFSLTNYSHRKSSNKLFDLIAGVSLRLLNTKFYPIYGIDLRGIQTINPLFGTDRLVNAFLSGFMFVIDPVEIVTVSLYMIERFASRKILCTHLKWGQQVIMGTN